MFDKLSLYANISAFYQCQPQTWVQQCVCFSVNFWKAPFFNWLKEGQAAFIKSLLWQSSVYFSMNGVDAVQTNLFYWVKVCCLCGFIFYEISYFKTQVLMINWIFPLMLFGQDVLFCRSVRQFCFCLDALYSRFYTGGQMKHFGENRVEGYYQNNIGAGPLDDAPVIYCSVLPSGVPQYSPSNNVPFFNVTRIYAICHIWQCTLPRELLFCP